MLVRWVSGRISCVSVAVAIAVLIGLLSILARFLSFLTIFNGRHTGIHITQPEVKAAYGGARESREQVVPKIIHQIYHNWKDPSSAEIPKDWEEVRKTCIDKNPGWEYKLWTEKASREFLETNYPHFLRTYDGYRYPVQRVDALRYFLMLHYGGIYIDLDNGCAESLEPLLYYPAWVTDGGRGALSNNILGARPFHPFWQQVTDQLRTYNWPWLLPYIIISYCSGQWFLTAMWDKYHGMLPKPSGSGPAVDHRLHQVMMDMRPGSDPWVFFTQGRGGSWDNWDNHLFGWLGNNLSQSIPALFMLLVFLGGSFVLARRFMARRRRLIPR